MKKSREKIGHWNTHSVSIDTRCISWGFTIHQALLVGILKLTDRQGLAILDHLGKEQSWEISTWKLHVKWCSSHYPPQKTNYKSVLCTFFWEVKKVVLLWTCLINEASVPTPCSSLLQTRPLSFLNISEVLLYKPHIRWIRAKMLMFASFIILPFIDWTGLQLLRWLRGKWGHCRRPQFNPWVGKIPWRRKWQPTPLCLPGKSHGQRSLAGHSPWGHKRVGQDLND